MFSNRKWLCVGLMALALVALGPAAPRALADGGMVMLPNGGQYEVALGAGLDVETGTIYVSGFAGSSTTLAGSVLSNGDVNTSFGGGVVLTQVAAVVAGYRGRDGSNACVVQPDGKLVSGGWYVEGKPYKQTYGIALVRYKPDGTLDTTFNPQYDRKGRIIGGGIVKTSFGANQAQINAIALQADGKILVTGRYFGLARYTANGKLDSTFGSGGLASMPASGKGIALHAGGIVVGAGVPEGMAVVRFTEDGSLDTTFGTAGVSTFAVPDPDPTTYTQLCAIAVDPADNGIIAAGKYSGGSSGAYQYHYYLTLARFKADGQLDTATFGNEDEPGYTTFGSGTGDYIAESVAVDADGKIVAAGYAKEEEAPANVLVARFNSNGTPDVDFNAPGESNPNGTPGYAADFPGAAHSVFIQPEDGKIVAAGHVTDQDSQTRIVIVRYLPDGTPDLSF